MLIEFQAFAISTRLHRLKKVPIFTSTMVHLIDIPEEIVRYISTFLMIEDVIHLSMTCKYFFYILPSYSIEEKVIEGPNLNSNEANPSWQHSPYFDTPPFMSHIFMLKIYSETKHMNIIRLQLIRPDNHSNGGKIITKSDFLIRHGLASSKVKFLSIEHPIILAMQPGDYFRFMITNRGLSEIKGKMEIVYRINTRGLCSGPKLNQQSTKNSTLIETNDELLQIDKRRIVNVPKMFEQQDIKSQIPEGFSISELGPDGDSFF